MEMPENLRELVDRLGQALVQALVTDERCRDLARQIQDRGFEVGLMIEATLALQRREDDSGEPETEGGSEAGGDEEPASGLFGGFTSPFDGEDSDWSAEDRAFLKKFKISLD